MRQHMQGGKEARCRYCRVDAAAAASVARIWTRHLHNDAATQRCFTVSQREHLHTRHTVTKCLGPLQRCCFPPCMCFGRPWVSQCLARRVMPRRSHSDLCVSSTGFVLNATCNPPSVSQLTKCLLPRRCQPAASMLHTSWRGLPGHRTFRRRSSHASLLANTSQTSGQLLCPLSARTRSPPSSSVRRLAPLC